MDNAVSIESRLSAMKKLHDEGTRTTCFISPIFPGITDVKAIVERIKNQRNLVWLENLNLRGTFRPVIMDYIRQQHAELVPLYKFIQKVITIIGESMIRNSARTQKKAGCRMSEMTAA